MKFLSVLLISIFCSIQGWSLSCVDINFKLTSPRYRALPSEVVALYARFPKIKENIDKAYDSLMQLNMSKGEITSIENIAEQGSMRIMNSSTDASDPAKLQALSPSLKKQIVDSYNLLRSKEQFAEYIRSLMQDVGVLMMRNQGHSTFRARDPSKPSAGNSRERTTKLEFLENGELDHQSLLTVLVSRIRERGDSIAVILKGDRGGFKANSTRTQKYDTFYEVPGRGPFIDLYFGSGSSHGQEGHLLQMDYVEQVLTDRREFWMYTTTLGKGDWVWDSMFDGTNGTLMHPEHFGPAVRRHIPLY